MVLVEVRRYERLLPQGKGLVFDLDSQVDIHYLLASTTMYIYAYRCTLRAPSQTVSLLTFLLSPIINHQSPNTNRQSPIISRQAPNTNHQSPITNRQSPITNHCFLDQLASGGRICPPPPTDPPLQRPFGHDPPAGDAAESVPFGPVTHLWRAGRKAVYQIPGRGDHGGDWTGAQARSARRLHMMVDFGMIINMFKSMEVFKC